MEPLHRLFFAVLPAPQARAVIAWLRDQRREIASIVANDRLHATMGITPDFSTFPDALAARLLAIGDAVAAEPVDVRLDRLSGSNGSLALRSARMLRGLGDLGRQLQLPMQRAGILRPEWSFNFHVTLGYREGRPFTENIDPIAWNCSEFVLIHSVVGRTQHKVLRRWPLARRQYGLFD
jgi:RNA 2',3'-cyclic 3'-phosphodiesterase